MIEKDKNDSSEERQEKGNLNTGKQNNDTHKIMNTITNLSNSIKMCESKKKIEVIYQTMGWSSIIIVLLLILFYVSSIWLKDAWSMVLLMFSMITLSLLFIWWMRYLNKLVADFREEMKPWQKKVTEAYSFLVDLEMMLHKAACEKQKKYIEKPDVDKLPKEEVDKLIEERSKEILNQVLKEKTIVDQWVVRLKETESKR